ncbi:MAG TPA: hypothetical protein VMV69_14875 [Pirellulales bacterium]|nr:hypothetical protein [Pirellulales bacterium]
MFAFLFPRRRVAARRRRPARVRRFESLDRRICLSAAPVIGGLEATVGTGHMVNISGFVMDQNPAGVQVALSGQVAANVTTDANGNFSYSGTASSLGTESAVATDSQGLSSSTVQTQIVDNPPVVSMLTVMETGNGKYVTVSGEVQSASPGGLTVSLSGVVGASPVTDSSGNFSVTTQASGLGTIDAATTDVWGVGSATTQVQLTNAAPSVSMMVAETGPDRTLTVSGHVTDTVEGGIVVTIGGIVSGTATTDSSGNYSLTAQASGQGTVTASATDIWGLISTLVQENFTSNAPMISNFNASLTSGGYWIFTGAVQDEWPAGLTVTLSGLTGGSATVLANGSFEYDSPLEYGNVEGAEYATVTDWWGNVSNTAQVWVMS